MSMEGLMPAHKASLHITHNDHKSQYQSAAEWVEDMESCRADGHAYAEWISDEQMQKAIETDSIWTVQWYPDTPVGFCCLAGADLEAVLAAAREGQ